MARAGRVRDTGYLSQGQRESERVREREKEREREREKERERMRERKREKGEIIINLSHMVLERMFVGLFCLSHPL